MSHPSHVQSGTRFQIRFRSLFHEGRGYAFPCDANGHVDLERLSARARANYLYARAAVGSDLQHPEVVRAHC